MRLIAAWHRRGIEVGFPELMARPRFATGGR
jgi:bifunctional isochorismate lyase/aryl carrier protein